jgi:hypothetical protein
MNKLIVTDYKIESRTEINGRLTGILVDLASGRRYTAYFYSDEMRWIIMEEVK